MATPVILPKQGQSVESCLIVEWKKAPGEPVQAGEVLCEIETDKAVMEVESPADGTLLATFFEAGDVAPVLVNIAAIGAPGEDVSALRPAEATQAPPAPTSGAPAPVEQSQTKAQATREPIAISEAASDLDAGPPPGGGQSVSPRARRLADQYEVDVSRLRGSGPGGRIIERDVEAARTGATVPQAASPAATADTLSTDAVATDAVTTDAAATDAVTTDAAATDTEPAPSLSPVARAMVEEGGYQVPAQGSGPRGRVMARDLQPAASETEPAADAITKRPLRGVRQVIAQRMRESLQSTAQLTLNRTADARALQRLRALFKASDPQLGLQSVSINDLLLYAVARTLTEFPMLNARLEDNTVYEYGGVHLGFAVDTPRGLLVPVIRDAHRLNLRGLAEAAKTLGAACQAGKVAPDDLTGGTFTVTNLGSLGIESFTPILNPPQAAILGVGAITLKPVAGEAGVEFLPHIHLSLTIDHQIVDGAPGARFLHALAARLAALDGDLVLAGAG